MTTRLLDPSTYSMLPTVPCQSGGARRDCEDTMMMTITTATATTYLITIDSLIWSILASRRSARIATWRGKEEGEIR